MKKLFIILLMFIGFTAFSQQGVKSLEIKEVTELSPIDLDTRIIVWDSTNFGKVKYTTPGVLSTLFGGGFDHQLTQDLQTNGNSVISDGSLLFKYDSDNNDINSVFSLLQSNDLEVFRIDQSGALRLNYYGQGAVTGTGDATYNLAVNTSGFVVERPIENTAGTTSTDNASYDMLPGSDVQTDLNYADNLLYALQPFDGGTFDGNLALNKINNTYYEDYDIETSGTITFAVDTTSTTLFGKDYLRIISDGVTPFADSTNVANVFDEIPQGIPSGYVLAEGMYSFYAQQNPSHRSFSLSPVKSQVVIGDDSPFFTDAIFHLDTRKNTPTLDGSEVVSTINIAEPSNIIQNTTGSNRPTWNATENSIDFNVDDFMNYDDVFVNRGSHSFLFVGNISSLVTSSEFTMHYNSEVSSARDFGLKIQGKILTVLNMNPDDSDQISSDSSRPTDPFYGDVMMLVTVDSVNEEMVIYIQNEIYSDTVTKVIPLDTAAPYNLNHLYNRNNDTTFGVEALTVWNKVMTPTEAAEILTYYTSY